MLNRPWLQEASLVLLDNSDSNLIVMLLQRVVGIIMIRLVESAAVLGALSHAQPCNHHTVFDTVALAKMLLTVRNKTADLLVRQNLTEAFDVRSVIEILRYLFDSLADHGSLDYVFWAHGATP